MQPLMKKHPLYDKAQERFDDILDAANEVLAVAGAGLPEKYYQIALQRELQLRGHEARREVSATVMYRGVNVAGELRADIVVDGCFIVELKAFDGSLNSKHLLQTLTYMRNLDCPLGLLYNFGATENTRWKSVLLPNANGGLKKERVRTASNEKSTRRLETMTEGPHPLYRKSVGIYADVLTAAHSVSAILADGRLEEMYYRSLAVELEARGHHTVQIIPVTLEYKKVKVETCLKSCIIVDNCFVLLPRVAHGFVTESMKAMCLTYMRHLNLPVGLIYNFGYNSIPRWCPRILKGANIGIEDDPQSPFYGYNAKN